MKHDYSSQGITISYDAKRCIHAEECVHGIAPVFEKGGKPWIHPDQGRPEQISAVIQRCPTGALHYVATEQSLEEKPNSVNTVVTAPRGPLLVRGDLQIQAVSAAEPEADTRAALCRCGASANKPYCDGSHHKAGFSDEGLAPVCVAEPAELSAQESRLEAVATPNGPLHLKGTFLIRNAAGDHIFTGTDAWLCRCGASTHKPFCDGSHARVGFQDS